MLKDIIDANYAVINNPLLKIVLPVAFPDWGLVVSVTCVVSIYHPLCCP